MSVEDGLAKKIFQCVATLFRKKNMSFVLDEHFREVSLNFNFSIASIKSSYGDPFPFPNKRKFDDGNIYTKLFIREQKIINNYVQQVNFFEVIRVNAEIFCTFEVWPQFPNI